MRILIFHGRLAHLTGGEVNVRDWALGLKARGHRVVIFSVLPGPLAERIRDAGVPVVDDPALVSDAPDVMLGAGINDAVAVLARFPEVPAIQVAQIWEHWNSIPCPLPQVVFHAAVDELNAEMLINEFGVARERVRVVHNAVDTGRLAERLQALPARPARALIFVKQDGPYVEAVRMACAERQIAADCVGYAVGRPVDEPLAVIRDYDLVVGAARTALEGAVGGAAVLVADHRGLAGLLTTANLDHFRIQNFGRELLTRPLDVATIGAEIDAYDPIDAAKVSAALGVEATLDRQLDRWEALFAEAIDRFRRFPPTADESRRALSAYLARHLPRPAAGDLSPRHERFGPIATVHERVSALERELTRVSALEAGLARLSAIAGEMARLSTLEREVARLPAIESEVTRLSKIELELARVSALERELARLSAVEALLPRMAIVEHEQTASRATQAFIERNLSLIRLIRLLRPLAAGLRKILGP
jgi:hypothetical protein